MQEPLRIVFKLSGEMLAGPEGSGIGPSRLAWLADEIKAARSEQVQIGLVLGAGNFLRGASLARTGVERTTADYMGMLGTVINSLALADLLVARGVPARVMSAIRMQPVAEPYSRAAAVEALGQGTVVIFAAGTGNPYFTTDTAASLRAAEVGADLLAKGTKVDGVYDKDPAIHADASVYEKISYDQVLARRLGVMDATAVAMCRDNALPVLVFGLGEAGSLARVASGELRGTLVA
jgi:uridylate kinase